MTFSDTLLSKYFSLNSPGILSPKTGQPPVTNATEGFLTDFRRCRKCFSMTYQKSPQILVDYVDSENRVFLQPYISYITA